MIQNNFDESIQITVLKSKLLEALEANKVTHKAKYEEALEGWRKECIKQLEDLQKRILTGKEEVLRNRKPYIIISLDEMPKDMTNDYSRAISMLTWHEGKEITLDQQKFNAFIHDEWSWKSHWTASNSKYLVS